MTNANIMQRNLLQRFFKVPDSNEHARIIHQLLSGEKCILQMQIYKMYSKHFAQYGTKTIT